MNADHQQRPGPVDYEGLRNVSFEQADAQVCRFPDARFDLAISRFGTMFFGDPAAAFGNIGRALRAAGRLVMLVWQAHDRNEWAVAIRQSLAPEGRLPVPAAGADPFSLASWALRPRRVRPGVCARRSPRT